MTDFYNNVDNQNFKHKFSNIIFSFNTLWSNLEQDFQKIFMTCKNKTSTFWGYWYAVSTWKGAL
jgi:hypothetical protein